MDQVSTLAPGAKLRQYQINSILGQGGFGITYLATDEDLHRKVAIKECFPRDFAGRSGVTVVPTTSNEVNFEWALGKFLDEATTLAKFKHAGIVQVLQIIKDENGTAYMVLEYLDGQPLGDWLKKLGTPPSPKQLRAILEPVLSALEIVHRNNYTHRDIAPDNIYIRANGESVLLDFGAAKLSVGQQSKTLNLVVKEGYSPPEQYYSEGRSGPWTDIYALSATIYRAIIGKRPVDAMARLDAVQNEEPDPLPRLLELAPDGYEPDFLAAVDEGLSPQLKTRPKDVEKWGRRLLEGSSSSSLSENLSEEPIETPKSTSIPTAPSQVQNTTPKKHRSRNSLIAAMLSILVGGISGGAYWLQQQNVAHELEAWNTAMSTGTEISLEKYLSDWPDGRHASKVKAELRLFGQNWSKSFGAEYGNEASAVTAGTDGTLWVASTKQATNGQLGQGWILKLAETGRLIRAKALSEATGNGVTSLISLPDGGALAAGFATRKNGGDLDAYITRLDMSGDIVWQRSYGQSGRQLAQSIAPLNDGGFIVAGTTASDVDGTLDGWVFRINGAGDMLWDKAAGSLWNDELLDIAASADGTLVAVGRTEPEGAAPTKFWVLKLTQNGEILIDRSLGGARADSFDSVFSRGDGSFVLAGETASASANSSDLIFTLLTTDNRFPPKIFPSDSRYYLKAISGNSSGEFYAAGWKAEAHNNEADAWLMKVAADARTIEWEQVFGGPGQQKITTLTTTQSGKLAWAGSSIDAGTNSGGLWVEYRARD